MDNFDVLDSPDNSEVYEFGSPWIPEVARPAVGWFKCKRTFTLLSRFPQGFVYSPAYANHDTYNPRPQPATSFAEATASVTGRSFFTQAEADSNAATAIKAAFVQVSAQVEATV